LLVERAGVPRRQSQVSSDQYPSGQHPTTERQPKMGLDLFRLAGELRPRRSAKGQTAMIKPDQQDFEAIEKKCGVLAANASDAEAAERYRLAQATKLIREVDEAAQQKK